MTNKEIVSYILDELKKQGADSAQCDATFGVTQEINALAGEIELLRTIKDQASIRIKAVIDNKTGSIAISTTDKESLDKGVLLCIEGAKSAYPDSAPIMNTTPVATSFYQNASEPNLSKLSMRTNELLDFIKVNYPLVNARQLVTVHDYEERIYANSYGVQLDSTSGVYSMDLTFSAAKDGKTSSFNFFGAQIPSLDKAFSELDTIATLLEQAEQQINPEKIKEKFVGTLVVSPSCVYDFIGQTLNAFASPNVLISGNSLWQNSLDTQVASEKLTLMSSPLNDAVAHKPFFTNDGFIIENETIIDKGVLKGFALDCYSANKTGLPRSKSQCHHFHIPCGDVALADIIASIDNGILINRYSGGMPGAAGDISGIAKNSFLIKDGKIQGAVKETMVSGNLSQMLKDIKAISKEVCCDGMSILPYIAFDSVTIS